MTKEDVLATGNRKLKILQVLMSFAASVAVLGSQAEERPPNVVLFLVDDLGWSDLGCYGSSFHETPHIDRFARENARFTQAYAACPVCSPTRASIMTGKYPAALRLTDWLPGRREFSFQNLKNAPLRPHLPFEEITLAEALREHGYATGHFGKWHLGEEPSGPLAHGFDVQVPKWNKGWPKAGHHAPFELDGLADAPGDYLTDRLTDEALNFIEENRHGPFFLYLSHFAVHDPIQAPADLVRKYEAKVKRSSVAGPEYLLEGNPDSRNALSRSQLDALSQQEEFRGYRVLPNRTVKIKQRQDNPVFAAMVESIDENFGRVLSQLDALGLSENTIVILYSDNGGMSAANFGRPDRMIASDKLDAAYSTSNLPLRGGKGWLYEGGIRVPLIVRWPGHGKSGVICDVPVTSPDLYPSILDMIGVAARPEQHTGGASFAPLVMGKTKLDRKAIYWHFPHYSNHGMQSPGGAIRRGGFKLIEYFENGTVQLFNLREDLGERNDQARKQPELAEELKKMLHEWRRQLSAAMMEPNPNYQPAERSHAAAIDLLRGP